MPSEVTEVSMVGRIIRIMTSLPLHKDISTLISRTGSHMAFPGKRDITGVIKLRILRAGDYFGLCKRAQCNRRGPYKKEVGGSESERKRCEDRSRVREIGRCYTAGFEGGL